MKDTIIVENFVLFHFDWKYFRVKININRDIAKIQFFSMAFQLSEGRGNMHTGGFSVSISEQFSTILPSFNSAVIFPVLFPDSPKLYNFVQIY